MDDLLKRKGKFTVGRHDIFDKPNEALKKLSDVLVVQTTSDFMRDSEIYIGFSKHFDLLEANEPIPTYVAEVKEFNGEIEVVWHRENEYLENDVKSMLKEIKEAIVRKGEGKDNE